MTFSEFFDKSPWERLSEFLVRTFTKVHEASQVQPDDEESSPDDLDAQLEAVPKDQVIHYPINGSWGSFFFAIVAILLHILVPMLILNGFFQAVARALHTSFPLFWSLGISLIVTTFLLIAAFQHYLFEALFYGAEQDQVSVLESAFGRERKDTITFSDKPMQGMREYIGGVRTKYPWWHPQKGWKAKIENKLVELPPGVIRNYYTSDDKLIEIVVRYQYTPLTGLGRAPQFFLTDQPTRENILNDTIYRFLGREIGKLTFAEAKKQIIDPKSNLHKRLDKMFGGNKKLTVLELELGVSVHNPRIYGYKLPPEAEKAMVDTSNAARIQELAKAFMKRGRRGGEPMPEDKALEHAEIALGLRQAATRTIQITGDPNTLYALSHLGVDTGGDIRAGATGGGGRRRRRR